MAAFSRGIGLGIGLSLTQRVVFSMAATTASKAHPERRVAREARVMMRGSPIVQAARNLHTVSARLHASRQAAHPTAKARVPPSAKPPARPAHALPPAKRPPTPPAAAAPAAALSHPSVVATKLAALGQPTVLYESPSHFWLRFSSLSAAAFLISNAGINYYINVMHPTPGLARWVPLAFAMVCLVSAGFGYLFLFASARIVRRITAVPTASLPASYLKPSSSARLSPTEEKARRALQASPVALECEVGGTLPLLGRKKVVVAPSEVLLPFKFAQAPASRAAGAPGDAKRRGAGGAFAGLRRGLTSEGFAPIMINGKRCKIDVLHGHVFDHGRALDILMPYRPAKFSNTWLDRVFKR